MTQISSSRLLSSALTAGDTNQVGVGGLTLGGGIGWMVRRHGLAIDSLAAAQVVTADGRLIGADAVEHADLFWALRVPAHPQHPPWLIPKQDTGYRGALRLRPPW
jgi:FAD/FMN-containing dehydrogenase